MKLPFLPDGLGRASQAIQPCRENDNEQFLFSSQLMSSDRLGLTFPF
jgi:hypothetical protein